MLQLYERAEIQPITVMGGKG